jgi:hypothetical protein
MAESGGEMPRGPSIKETPARVAPYHCAHCGCPMDGDRILVTAASVAEHLWKLYVCGPCWEMLLAAIELELAGAGPGGHRDLHRDARSPPENFPPGWVRQRDAKGRFGPR